MMARSNRSAEKEQSWRLMVDQQRQGDLNIREFCRQRAISEPSFYAWRKELRKRDAARSAGGSGNAGRRREKAVDGERSGRLIPVEVVGARGESDRASHDHQRKLPLEICTPGGLTLRFDHDTPSDTVARLLDVIARCPIGRRPLPMEHANDGAASC